MGGKPCIQGMRVTVGTVVGLVAAGRTREEILREYPYLEAEDIAGSYMAASWTRLVQAVELVDAIWRDDVEAVRRLVTAKAWGRSHSTGGS
jgi:uncharacterized protein (DUF433 family)